MERNLQLKSVRSWSLFQKWQLVACGKYLLGSQTFSKVESKCRWEYRGRADECHKHAKPEPQQCPRSHFTLFTGSRYLCPPEKSVLQHTMTSQRVGICRCVSPTHRTWASTSWHCCAGRRQAQGDWAWTPIVVKWPSPPDIRCLGGHSQLQWANRAAMPRAGVGGFARAQHVWLQPLRLWVAHKVMLCWTEDRVREMGAAHSLARTGWTEVIVSRRQDSMIYEDNSCTVWRIWQEISRRSKHRWQQPENV